MGEPADYFSLLEIIAVLFSTFMYKTYPGRVRRSGDVKSQVIAAPYFFLDVYIFQIERLYV
jgi:hypothetical protein